MAGLPIVPNPKNPTTLYACKALLYAWSMAQIAAKRMLLGKSPNYKFSDTCKCACDNVDIEIKCDSDAKRLTEEGEWEGVKLPTIYGKRCKDLCGRKVTKRAQA